MIGRLYDSMETRRMWRFGGTIFATLFIVYTYWAMVGRILY